MSTRHASTCDCQDCDQHRRRTKKLRELNRARGIPGRVDPAEARQHLAVLRQTMSWTHIAEAVGTSTCHARGIANGATLAINRATHNKILAVKPATSPDIGLYIDAIGSVRRVRALMAIGHPQYAIAAAGGTTQARVVYLSQGQPRMRQKLANKIEKAYRELSNHPGSSTRARGIAAKNNWADPAWWSDMGGIDDPDAPETDAPTIRYIALGEDGLELYEQGYSPKDAAARLGVTRDYLEASIRRYRDTLRAAA